MLPIGIIACIFCSVSLISSGFLLYWVWNVSANKNQSSVFSFLLLYNFLCQAYSLAALILRDPERPVFYVICIFLISAGFYFADAHVIIEMVKIYSVLDPELLNANRLRKFRILHFLFLFGFASLCIVGLMQTYNGNIDRSLGLGFILAFVWNL